MKLYRLEALRGFAAFYVVLHHSFPHNIRVLGFDVGFFLRFGQEAVILFFLLSGFVINYSFRIGNDKSFKSYFFKRSTRIYIPLLIVMFFGYCIECFRENGLVNPQLGNLALNLLMLQDVAELKPNVIVAPYLGNTPLWSLSYEWWFYLLYFPIFKLVPDIKNNKCFRDYFVFGIAIFCGFWYVIYPDALSRVLTYFIIWWAGVVLSDLYLNNILSMRKLLPLIITMSFVTFIFGINVYLDFRAGNKLMLGVHPVLEFRHFAFASVVVVCSMVWRNLHWFGFDALFKPFLLLAPISYTLYISHQYLVVQASYLSWLNFPPVEWLVYFSISMLFCYVLELRIYPVFRDYIFRRTSNANCY